MRDIPYYKDFISDEFLDYLLSSATVAHEMPDLLEVGNGGGLESKESFEFLCTLYVSVKDELNRVLVQRIRDREFIDQRTKSSSELNRVLRIDYLDSDYETLIGQTNTSGAVIVGPLNEFYNKKGYGKAIPRLPKYLEGFHVTLFGPPDNLKLSVNAMNAFHRRIQSEPPIISKLLDQSLENPKWGADDEDSKTPLRQDLISAGQNLSDCFSKNISFEDPQTKKIYKLEKDHLSVPIKRFPGLALPCTFLFLKQNPLPLHLYDFALHLFHNWHRKEALSFYVPKLETVDEAAYIKFMIETAEKLIVQIHPTYVIGSVKLFIVLENPRLIFRVNEMMDRLHPYFAGASLGWHDYLASTARLFKNDSNYRIPVKADPNIVIKYIKASHELLAEVVGSRGGIKIGGMYGVLPNDNNLASESFQLTMRGYLKDVITQLKRNLTGFWVAHPDFVRIGIAITEAWKLRELGDTSAIENLATSLLSTKYHAEILSFIRNPDLKGLNVEDPLYARSLIVADLKASQFIANNDPEEIRYNVFQSLQYLTDWLCGNGCVALPAQIESISVRVMDDLATAERSRWEVWHEIYNKRFTIEDFLTIVAEEMLFIRKDFSKPDKIVQVKFDERTEKWYRVALHIMIQLMTCVKPVEFATELLMVFTDPKLRLSSDPLSRVLELEPAKYKIETYIEKYSFYFSVCGVQSFAKQMAEQLSPDVSLAEQIILSFTPEEIKSAAQFHGDIGEKKLSLDHLAREEQNRVADSNLEIQRQLKQRGNEYLQKFGVKFLIAASELDGAFILQEIERRLNNTPELELQNARNALWNITEKRIKTSGRLEFFQEIESALKRHRVNGAQICISNSFGQMQNISLGYSRGHDKKVQTHTWFEIASLSKTLASCFAIDYFTAREIPLTTTINSLLSETKSKFRIPSLVASHPEWGDHVTLIHLMEHSAINMHYVKGFCLDDRMPDTQELLNPQNNFGYAPVGAICEPGSVFHYSGGGYLLLQHLIESIEEKSIYDITKEYFEKQLKIKSLTFNSKPNGDIATGYFADGEQVKSSRLVFPAFAAGAMGTAEGVSQLLNTLTSAFRISESSPLSHSTAVQLFFSSDKSSQKFMSAKMGLGVFTAEAGANRLAIHQGANDGFRCIFVHCYDGPDTGKGFVILCNADTNGVAFICEVAQKILIELSIQGININLFKKEYHPNGIATEEIVNFAYKNMIFNAFEPDLPEQIIRTTKKDSLLNLSASVEARILEVTNQGFARAENLFAPFAPIYDPELYGQQGKVMDSWESVRHNPLFSDYLIFETKNELVPKYVFASTQFHNGNHAPKISLEAWSNKSLTWIYLLNETDLDGHAAHYFTLDNFQESFSRFKVSQIPDGGLTRLAIYSAELELNFKKLWSQKSPQKFIEDIPQPLKPIAPIYKATYEIIEKNFLRLKPNDEFNITSTAYGAKISYVSNQHYGLAEQVISPFPPMNMFDGFESARSRNQSHHEEAVIDLFKPCRLHRLEVDFSFFKNNNPREIAIQGYYQNKWIQILKRTPVKTYAGNIFTEAIENPEKFEKIKIFVYPDGGINRLRMYSFKESV